MISPNLFQVRATIVVIGNCIWLKISALLSKYNENSWIDALNCNVTSKLIWIDFLTNNILCIYTSYSTVHRSNILAADAAGELIVLIFTLSSVAVTCFVCRRHNSTAFTWLIITIVTVMASQFALYVYFGICRVNLFAFSVFHSHLSHTRSDELSYSKNLKEKSRTFSMGNERVSKIKTK